MGLLNRVNHDRHISNIIVGVKNNHVMNKNSVAKFLLNILIKFISSTLYNIILYRPTAY